jgi:aspartate aminotransferase/aromatic-amino-acid transaminase
MAPLDPILGLTDAFNEETNPKKVNLGVGVYKDSSGKTPIFSSVKKAERRILEDEKTKSYMPISGAPEYATAVQEMIFGKGAPVLAAKRVVTAHTPGGTGGLRVAGDFLSWKCGKKKIWVSDPTWANHNSIFESAGMSVASYPYYDAKTMSLDFEAMIQAVRQIPEGDVLLLHGCCHNPTGLDPLPDQWRQIADAARERKLVLLVDLAYQGFAEGVAKDVQGVHALLESGCDMLISSSFSKNFGLYRDRVGALSLVGSSAEFVAKAMSQLKTVIRSNYSNPPAHGALIVSTIWNDPALKAEWEAEVKTIRERIHEMRHLFVDSLKAKGVKRDFSFIAKQAGMFSFSGLNKDQVARLRDEYAIYMVASGRMNVAGMTRDNIDYLCDAVAAVL